MTLGESPPQAVGNAPGRGRWLTVANGLTALRLAAGPACAVSILAGLPRSALVLFVLAVATDLADGRVARRRGEASSLGALLDHATDALFVTTGLAAAAHAGVVTSWLPPLILLAFTQYALDSRALAGQRLRTSVVGRCNGIAYYVLLGVVVVRDAAGLLWPGPVAVAWMARLLVGTTCLSMTSRAWAWWRHVRAVES